eukprot:1807882-Pyramimonas_sp.AAC.1
MTTTEPSDKDGDGDVLFRQRRRRPRRRRGRRAHNPPQLDSPNGPRRAKADGPRGSIRSERAP